MTFLRGLLLVLFAVVLIIAAAAWYLLGTTGISAAKLVPGDTLAFALIPNGISLGRDYNTSQLKKIVDSPNAQPLLDRITRLIGDKNLALLRVLAPDLSGQSFIAITHFDPSKPNEIGFVAGMKPKLGSDNFDTFVQQVNAAYPDLAHKMKTGRDTLLGLDYQWLETPRGRICVAHYHGWVITAWGEASLQDCLERLQGKSPTPSLADNADFQKSRDRVGATSQALLYLDYARVAGLWMQRVAASNPTLAATLKKRVASIGGLAVGTSFENGEIVDHLSILEPKQAQLDAGLSPAPCSFDTLKFTGPDTRFYFGSNVNWQQIWKNFQEQLNAGQPGARAIVDRLEAFAQSENIDVQKNIIDALGPEYSFQVEWASDSLYPDIGVYFKINKPDDFKPTIAAIVDASRKAFATTAVITEMNSSGHNFATLKMVRPMPVNPTITEDGPYFGLFLNETHAVRSMAREDGGLLRNDDFNRQIGDQRNGAAQIVFLDTPKLLDQAYRTALPFVPMSAMLNPTLGSLVKGRQLPPDLGWLAPMGTWSAVVKSDDDGLTAYSRSGVGNQGILLAGGLGAGAAALHAAGLLPQHHYTTPTPGNPFAPSPAPSNQLTPPTPVIPPAPATPPAPPDATTPPSPPGSTH